MGYGVLFFWLVAVNFTLKLYSYIIIQPVLGRDFNIYHDIGLNAVILAAYVGCQDGASKTNIMHDNWRGLKSQLNVAYQTWKTQYKIQKNTSWYITTTVQHTT